MIALATRDGSPLPRELAAHIEPLIVGSSADRESYAIEASAFNNATIMQAFVTHVHDGWNIAPNILIAFCIHHIRSLSNTLDLNALRVTAADFDQSRLLVWFRAAYHIPPSRDAAPYVREMRLLAAEMLRAGRLSIAYCKDMLSLSSSGDLGYGYLIYDGRHRGVVMRWAATTNNESRAQEARDALAKMNDQRDRIFHQYWLPGLLPKAEYEQVRQSAIPLLRELYDDIYEHGAEYLYRACTPNPHW